MINIDNEAFMSCDGNLHWANPLQLKELYHVNDAAGTYAQGTKSWCPLDGAKDELSRGSVAMVLCLAKGLPVLECRVKTYVKDSNSLKLYIELDGEVHASYLWLKKTPKSSLCVLDVLLSFSHGNILYKPFTGEKTATRVGTLE